MRSRRTSIDIVAEILRLKVAGKTQIMYGARLSHTQLEKYLRFLTDNGFLDCRKRGSSSRYYTTTKGDKLLGDISKIQTMMDVDREGDGLRERLGLLEEPEVEEGHAHQVRL